MVDFIRTPIAVGELIDKITILEIKIERFTDAAKIANVQTELALLEALRDEVLLSGSELAVLSAELKSVNEEIWDLGDAIRAFERQQDFGPGFVDAARTIHSTNDRRAAIKRRINVSCGSRLIEEKSYEGY